MIDGSEKRTRQLVFELQSSRVYEKRCKSYYLSRLQKQLFFSHTNPYILNVTQQSEKRETILP